MLSPAPEEAPPLPWDQHSREVLEKHQWVQFPMEFPTSSTSYLGTGLAVVWQKPNVSLRHVVSLTKDGRCHSQVESCSPSTVLLQLLLDPGSADHLSLCREPVQATHWCTTKQEKKWLLEPRAAAGWYHGPLARPSPPSLRLHVPQGLPSPAGPDRRRQVGPWHKLFFQRSCGSKPHLTWA